MKTALGRKEYCQKEWQIILIRDEKLSSRVQRDKRCDKSLKKQFSLKRKVIQLTKSLNAFCTTEPKKKFYFIGYETKKAFFFPPF